MKRKFWFVNANDANAAVIYLYGYIGCYDDSSASEFVKELNELQKNHSTIELHINSNGGSVFEGLAIISAIKNSKAKIIGYVDGIAASMAAVIALCLSECYMSKYARLMTHRVQGGCYGNADELRAQADEVQSIENDLVDLIASKTGLAAEEVKKQYITNQDKWMTATDALKAKLITGIVDGPSIEMPKNAVPELVYSIYEKEFSNTISQPTETIFLL